MPRRGRGLTTSVVRFELLDDSPASRGAQTGIEPERPRPSACEADVIATTPTRHPLLAVCSGTFSLYVNNFSGGLHGSRFSPPISPEITGPVARRKFLRRHRILRQHPCQFRRQLLQLLRLQVQQQKALLQQKLLLQHLRRLIRRQKLLQQRLLLNHQLQERRHRSHCQDILT